MVWRPGFSSPQGRTELPAGQGPLGSLARTARARGSTQAVPVSCPGFAQTSLRKPAWEPHDPQGPQANTTTPSHVQNETSPLPGAGSHSFEVFFKEMESTRVQTNQFNSLRCDVAFPGCVSQGREHCVSCVGAATAGVWRLLCDLHAFISLCSEFLPLVTSPSQQLPLLAEFLEPSFKGQTFELSLLKLKCP